MASVKVDIREFPALIREYSQYKSVIAGSAEKTVTEYMLDLRTFFRFMTMRRMGLSLEPDEFEKISIRDMTINDIRDISAQNIIDYLMFAGFERANNTTTRMRKLSSLRSFFHYAHGKRHYLDSNPTSDVDAPKKSKTLPK